MGTWGTGSFENDNALDWLQDYAEEPASLKILSALHLTGDDGLPDSLDCEEAIAAAEVICLVNGYPLADFPEEEKTAISEKKVVAIPEHTQTAITTIKRIIKHSELRKLWAETDDLAAWEKAMEELLSRLHKTALSVMR